MPIRPLSGHIKANVVNPKRKRSDAITDDYKFKSNQRKKSTDGGSSIMNHLEIDDVEDLNNAII